MMGRDNGTEITTVPRLLSRLIDQIFLSPVIRLSILACTVNSACYEYHFNCFLRLLSRENRINVNWRGEYDQSKGKLRIRQISVNGRRKVRSRDIVLTSLTRGGIITLNIVSPI